MAMKAVLKAIEQASKDTEVFASLPKAATKKKPAMPRSTQKRLIELDRQQQDIQATAGNKIPETLANLSKQEHSAQALENGQQALLQYLKGLREHVNAAELSKVDKELSRRARNRAEAKANKKVKKIASEALATQQEVAVAKAELEAAKKWKGFAASPQNIAVARAKAAMRRSQLEDMMPSAKQAAANKTSFFKKTRIEVKPKKVTEAQPQRNQPVEEAKRPQRKQQIEDTPAPVRAMPKEQQNVKAEVARTKPNDKIEKPPAGEAAAETPVKRFSLIRKHPKTAAVVAGATAVGIGSHFFDDTGGIVPQDHPGGSPQTDMNYGEIAISDMLNSPMQPSTQDTSSSPTVPTIVAAKDANVRADGITIEGARQLTAEEKKALGANPDTPYYTNYTQAELLRRAGKTPLSTATPDKVSPNTSLLAKQAAVQAKQDEVTAMIAQAHDRYLTNLRLKSAAYQEAKRRYDNASNMALTGDMQARTDLAILEDNLAKIDARLQSNAQRMTERDPNLIKAANHVQNEAKQVQLELSKANQVSAKQPALPIDDPYVAITAKATGLEPKQAAKYLKSRYVAAQVEPYIANIITSGGRLPKLSDPSLNDVTFDMNARLLIQSSGVANSKQAKQDLQLVRDIREVALHTAATKAHEYFANLDITSAEGKAFMQMTPKQQMAAMEERTRTEYPKVFAAVGKQAYLNNIQATALSYLGKGAQKYLSKFFDNGAFDIHALSANNKKSAEEKRLMLSQFNEALAEASKKAPFTNAFGVTQADVQLGSRIALMSMNTGGQ